MCPHITCGFGVQYDQISEWMNELLYFGYKAEKRKDQHRNVTVCNVVDQNQRPISVFINHKMKYRYEYLEELIWLSFTFNMPCNESLFYAFKFFSIPKENQKFECVIDSFLLFHSHIISLHLLFWLKNKKWDLTFLESFLNNHHHVLDQYMKHHSTYNKLLIFSW